VPDLVAIWTRQYIRPADIKVDRIHMTEDRLTKMVNDAYAAGKNDENLPRFREGVIAFAEDVRKVIADFPQGEHEHGPHLIPAWAIERLMEQWNVPASTPSQESGE
jgi:hypothetical protein